MTIWSHVNGLGVGLYALGVPSFTTDTVVAIEVARDGLQRVRLDSGRRAFVLTQLVGPVAVGDRVVVNTTAVDLGLGTGGSDIVHWNLARDAWSEPGPGHVMKLRYTSLQVDTGSLYPALHRLIRRGWISFDHGMSENNRRAKYYRLTAKGRRQHTRHTMRCR